MIWKRVAILVCLVSAALGLEAQTPVKIGVIDIEKALGGTAEGQKATLAVSAKIGPQQKAFDARQQEIANLTDQLNKGSNLLSDEKKSEMARDIDEKKKRLERDMQDANDNLREEQQRLVQDMGQRLTSVITKYAKDNGFALIFAGGPNGSVVYAADAIDVTNNVIQLYDKTYPASASPKP